ncbi:coiled-coil domain-containing protein 186 isoform X2 [Microplitis mediator]|uniref:coiled-coil domain-containing protein 186 isoform X2 n=1 Tax=Microplitis mediator TaxID=375433 RepID=UPI002556107D|nr:coiled-coil domain-containing protein 186 isoform X2 [Microplitis mediator]
MEATCNVNSNELNFVNTTDAFDINHHNDNNNSDLIDSLSDSSKNESNNETKFPDNEKNKQTDNDEDQLSDNIENLSAINNLQLLPINENDKINDNNINLGNLQFKSIKINESTIVDGNNKLINKLSLPSHSNLIQSSVPLINKSRHLFNFITEKSTNIMEKALLPQYLQQRDLINQKHIIGANNDNSVLNGGDDDEKSQVIKDENEEKLKENYLQQAEDDKIINGGQEIKNCGMDDDRDEEIEYKVLLDEYKKIKNDKIHLEERIKELENRNQFSSKESISSSIDNRDATINRLTLELRSALSHQENLLQRYTSANKERESMVMKYAISEKQRLDLQRTLDQSHSRLKQLTSDNEIITSKLKTAFNERSRVAQMLDVKCRELIDAQKELEKLREDLDIREVKLKWTQTKLKSETQLHKETADKLEKALTRINELKDECENVRRESSESIKKFQQSEENKAVTLDQQLKEQHARLILERHVVEDKEAVRLQLLKEIETLNHRQQVLIEENNVLTLRCNDFEAISNQLKKSYEELKVISEERLKAISDLTLKSEALESTRLELVGKNQELAAIENELERLRAANNELQNDMDCCVERENQMLEFTQKLTDKNVRLQSDSTMMESRLKELEREQGPLREQVKELKIKIKEMAEELKEEKKKRVDECEILARHLAEQTKMAEDLKQMLEDSKGENSVLKRKHQMTIKELTREVGQLKKKLELTESNTEGAKVAGTRTPSVMSLNDETNGDADVGIIYNELDKQALIERVIKLQRINVKRAEKLDFLEEHTRVLVTELQKKTKIIQNYILNENFDAMGSNERDRYKAELIKHGGIMASVYHQRVSDDNMTLELSLEINQKLQAVLEDALLKNITLKDNIDTLGDEIAKLTIQNQKISK